MASTEGHFLEGKKIIVAGSGIAGMSFIASFSKQWDSSRPMPEIVVCDRDPRDIDQKREGYSLSLNGAGPNDGLVAFRDLDLLDEVLQHSLTGPDNVRVFRLWDSDFNSFLEPKAKPYGDLPTAGIRISRKMLRKVLRDTAENIADIK
jgi:2-polyprenyl-6-methoxyphenol hydroxylase-like FAD-dependent oxidoreductase